VAENWLSQSRQSVPGNSAPRRAPLMVLVTAMRDDPCQGIANGLCANCADLPNLPNRVTDKYRQTMISDLRVIPEPHPDPGPA